MNPGGISSTWWDTSTIAGESASGEHRQRRHEVLAAAEVEAGGGLVEQQQLGVGHQRPRDLHPFALALAEGAERAVGEVVDAELDQQLVGALVVELVVLLAPAADHAVRRGHDHVAHPLVARDPLGEGRAGQADPRPQLEDVDGAEDLAEDAGDTGVGWICAEATCSRVVLPAPFGPSTTQRSSSSTVQSIDVDQRRCPRRTVTPASSRTAAMAATLSTDARSGAYRRAP